jgi:hypothetical protein
MGYTPRRTGVTRDPTNRLNIVERAQTDAVIALAMAAEQAEGEVGEVRLVGLL